MKKQLLFVPVFAVLASCSSIDRSTAVVDDAGHTHYTMGMDADHRGRALPGKREGTGNKVFLFDPKLTAWGAYDADGNLVKSGSASGGQDFCPDVAKPCRTVTGTFKVYSKKGEDCKSSIYPVETHGGGRMPYCMHFHGGYSIHAAYQVPNYNTSHGCIRVLPSAAKWLNEDFVDVGTTVVVKPY